MIELCALLCGCEPDAVTVDMIAGLTSRIRGAMSGDTGSAVATATGIVAVTLPPLRDQAIATLIAAAVTLPQAGDNLWQKA